MTFREGVNFWGTIIFGTLMTVGAGIQFYDKFIKDDTSASTGATQQAGPGAKGSGISSSLSASETADVSRMKSAGRMAGGLGHEISPNTKLFVITNDFGENPKCAVHVQAIDPKTGGLSHPNWDLVVQVGGGSDIVWTNNAISANAGEVRLTIDGGGVVRLSNVVSAQGRGTESTAALISQLSSARTAKTSSGLVGDTELAFTYDMGAFQKAFRYAKAMCS